MSIQSQTELENTREKLRRLEEHYAGRTREPAANPRLREISLRSLKQTMNQLKEEIVRYEAHAKTGSSSR
jgi:hypothetical protein